MVLAGRVNGDRTDVLDGPVQFFLRRRLPLFQAILDGGAWAFGITVATLARYDFRTDPVNTRGVVELSLVAVMAQVAIGMCFGLYRRRYHYGSFDEVRALVLSIVGVAIPVAIISHSRHGRLVPRSVPFIAAFLALVVAGGVRYMYRLWRDASRRPLSSLSAPVIIFGAGEGGVQLVHTTLRDASGRYRPVAMLDDNPDKQRFRTRGIRVEGTRLDIAHVAARHGATALVIAIPSANGTTVRELSQLARAANLDTFVLPPVADLLGPVSVADVRRVTVNDLLGRNPAEIDAEAIAGYLRGRRVLVTGAGGSIGSELCRQIHQYGPASLIMMDRDESGLHATQLSIAGRALLDSPDLALGDIRDADRVQQIFQEHRPDVVFHAAALKHLPMLERQPAEAWKTNVVGTTNVLAAALATGVGRLVNISTDKAAEPISVLGWSKRICERLTADAASGVLPYVSVRFGNVLASRGSVLTTFEHQIAVGGPVTVTDRNVTRYFMTIHEAAALTIQSAAIGEPGEVLVLDMGEPVRIDDVAKRLIEDSGKRVAIEYTGLREGEKLHEVLLGSDETDRRPNHPLISQTAVPPLSIEAARSICTVDGRLTITAASLALVAASLAAPDRTPATTAVEYGLVE